MAETNPGEKKTLNLLSPPSSRRQGESSPSPQAKTLNTGRDAALLFSLVPIDALNSLSVCGCKSVEKNIKSNLRPASKEIQVMMETRTNQNRPKHSRLKTSVCTGLLSSNPPCILFKHQFENKKKRRVLHAMHCKISIHLSVNI